MSGIAVFSDYMLTIYLPEGKDWVLWCKVVINRDVSADPAAASIKVDDDYTGDKDKSFVWNVDTYLPDNTASYPRKH
jgi:hypothetical protein